MDAPGDKIDFDQIASQVEKRLDEIFEPPSGRSEIQIQYDKDFIIDRLDRLHKILLSIDLKASDQLIEKYLKHIEHLKQTFRQHKFVFTLLKLQSNLIHYIKTYKKNAHPFAIKMLHSAFDSMCVILKAKNMKKNDRLRIMNKEINQYKKFHKFVTGRRELINRSGIKTQLKSKHNSFKSVKPIDQLQKEIPDEIVGLIVEKATSDIKRFIRSEINKLRLELQAGLSKNGI